ncbi:hypothetical protein CPB85DRAFT_749160 [Mucidula mucida]|nr:hypothetical protein CPB85DRAFT_749160 [Mucidula mucida]
MSTASPQCSDTTLRLTDGSHPIQSIAQTLPYEIVCLIFSFVAGFSRRRLAPGVFGPFWAGTQICHVWRDALRGEARLWKKLAVCMPIAGDWHTENRVSQLFSGALERSKDLPLYIEFHSYRMSLETIEVLKKIMAVAPRITNLRLDLPMRFINIILSPENTACFSNVGCLRVNGRLDADWESVEPVLWQRTFPALVDVKLQGLAARYLTSLWGPCTWRGIAVHLLATNAEDFRIPAELLEAIKGSPNLQSIRFSSSWFPPMEYEDPVVPDPTPAWCEAYDAAVSTFDVPTMSQSVWNLHLGSWEAGILPAVLTLPKLRTLFMEMESLSADDTRGTYILTGIQRLITRSQCSLTAFNLTMTDFHDGVLDVVLGSMPNLRILNLHFQADPHGLLELMFDWMKLRNDGGRFIYLAHLASMRLEVIPSFGYVVMEEEEVKQIQNTNIAFVEMVLERWETVDEEDPLLARIDLDVPPEGGADGLLNLDCSSIELLEERVSDFSDVKFDRRNKIRRPRREI